MSTVAHLVEHMTTFRSALTDAESLARAHYPTRSAQIDRAMQLIRDGRVFQSDDGAWTVDSASSVGVQYAVNGHCGCADSHYRAGAGPCKHMLAVQISRKTLQLMAQQTPLSDAVPAQGTETEPHEPMQGIDPHWIIRVQGKNFVRFEGLLSVAHERGLVSLETTVVRVTAALAVCQSTARFSDGLTVTDVGDASPDNVARHLKPHFIRMAATRASARALRRALNIDMCSVEELAGES